MGEEGVVFVRRASGLVREIGWFSALTMVLGHVIGGGINWHSTKDAVYYPGCNVPMAFFVAGVPSVLLAICFALMAVMMPRAGGDYIYITRAMDPLIGFMASWAFWFTEAISFGIIGAFDSVFYGMSIWMFGLMQYKAGAAGAENIMNFGKWMSSTQGQIIVGTILVVIFCLIALLGTRALAYVMNIIVIIPIITGFLTIGYFSWGAMNAPLRAKEKFEAIFGTGTWDKILETAPTVPPPEGVPQFDPEKFHMGASWAATMGMATPATWAYIGFTCSSFFGSEVKDPSRSLMISMVLGAILIMVYYLVISGTCWAAYGDFITAYNYIWESDKAHETEVLAGILGVSEAPGATPGAPEGILPFFAAILAYPRTPIMVILILTGAIWLMNDIPAFLMVTSRSIFAWSFDRFFPEIIAEVNERWHSPHYAILITCIVGIIGVVANAYAWFLAMVGTTVLAIWRYLFDAMAATILPYRRPEIWEKGLKLSVAGIPLITILGFIAFVWWNYIFWFACLALDSTTIATYAGWLGFGLLIFVGYWVYNQKRGIDPRTIYQEIPPA
ncbi:MAG: APC family permease [Candidatus Baldrarchaeia archaeon]